MKSGEHVVDKFIALGKMCGCDTARCHYCRVRKAADRYNDPYSQQERRDYGSLYEYLNTWYRISLDKLKQMSGLINGIDEGMDE